MIWLEPIRGTSGRSSDFSDGTSGQDEYRGMLRYDHLKLMQFRTDAAERLRILSDGKVAIGGVTANSQLDVHGGDGISITHSGDTFLQSRTTGTTGTNYLEFKDSGGAAGAISYHHNGNSLRFKVDGTERLFIDSSGRLLVGHASLTGDGDSAYSRVVVNGNTQATSKGGILSLENTAPSISSVFGGHELGQIFFKVETGEEFGLIKVEAEADATSSSCPGRIVFSTTASGATTPTDRMRLDSSGLLLLGTGNPSSYVGGGNNFVITGSGDAGMTIASGTSNSGTINFADGSSGDARYRGRVEYSHSLDALDILTAATTQIRIDNSGRVLLGTLNSTGTQLIKVNGDTSATTNGGHIALTQGRTSPGNGATHGVISFGTETKPEVVKVVSFVDGTWSDGQYHPSGLYIATTDYNRNSPTEKIRITDIGEVNCYSTGAVIQLEPYKAAVLTSISTKAGVTKTLVVQELISFGLTAMFKTLTIPIDLFQINA